ncbi:MAG: hypothetical protein J6B25_06790 [Clostridia bacterium]|nr:hypothetical protein [Clostridia bacterium]
MQDGAPRTFRRTRCRLLHQALENLFLPDYCYGSHTPHPRYGRHRRKHTALHRYRRIRRRCTCNAQARLA